MNDLLEMQSRVSKKFHDKFQSFCDPLVNCFEVNQFYHYQLSRSGHFVNLGLNFDWEQWLLSNDLFYNLPMFKNQENFKEGIVFLTSFDDEKNSILWETAYKKFNVNFTIELVNKTREGSEGFGFGLKSSDPLRKMAFLKELPLLKLFIKQYREEFKSDIPNFYNYAVDISRQIKPSIFPIKASEYDANRNQFLKKMRIEIPSLLTEREVDVASYLIKGYSASEIGEKLFIARRTVEHHLERMKDKFDCPNKSVLIRKIQELETIGYFL